MTITEFSQAVIEKIGYYVYLLADPDTDKIFYVGKGTGNRVFAHARDALDQTTSSDKLDRIREIRARGQKVVCEILRHGLTEKEAFEVESTLIDFIGLEALSNRVAGMHAETRGRMRLVDIVAQYDAKDITINEPMLLLTLNRYYDHSMTPEDLYEYTRGNWVLSASRKDKVKYACAVYRGIVREVYEIKSWMIVKKGRPGEDYSRPRWRFDGVVAQNLQHYIGGRVEHYTQNSQNPVRYVNDT